MKTVVMLTDIIGDLSAIRAEVREIRRMFESGQYREYQIEGGIRHE